MLPIQLIAAAVGGSPLLASIDDATLVGSGSGASETGFVTSNIGTITVDIGIGPFTYSWEIDDDPASSGPYNPVNQTSAATAFNDTVSALDGDSVEIWKCVVTDTGNGNKTVDVGLTVTLTWTDTT